MKLLIDVGNTAVKLALCNGEGIQAISADKLDWDTITEVVVGKVGKSEHLTPYLAEATARQVPVYEAEVSATLGQLQCAYPQYQNLGIDRWLAVIAAYYLYPQQACIIIDSGTATTVDVLSAQGKHLGGWIIPGLDMMMKSLTANTQKVFVDEDSPFLLALGKNTPNAVKNGCLAATLGCLYQAIHLLALPQSEVRVLCTGGYGALLQQHVAESEFIADLVLQGLAYWRLAQGN
ncbi:type III pantothenate kinase [Pseudoalteromonas fenneropenaei]|uniref:Type III pantothenate kinase n=1 Tax=Pseudoalteromonas fenneropenaei TaxID=1737459 RepID=A0ABV7CP65_9GAMM